MSSDGLVIQHLRESIIRLERKQLLVSKERGWCRRILTWMKENQLYENRLVFEPSIYIDHLRSLQLKAHQAEITFLCRIFQLSGYEVNYFENRSWKIVEPQIRIRKALPTTSVIRNDLSKLDLFEGLFVLLLYVSGRRSIDLIRLKSSNVTVVDDDVNIILEYCKTKKKLSSYKFTIVHDLEMDDLPHLKLFATLLQQRAFPFENINISKIALKLSFTPHTLRSCRAIQLVLQGLSVPEVMSQIGWSEESTYKHYIRLPTSSILKLNNFDKVVTKINSQL